MAGAMLPNIPVGVFGAAPNAGVATGAPNPKDGVVERGDPELSKLLVGAPNIR